MQGFVVLCQTRIVPLKMLIAMFFMAPFRYPACFARGKHANALNISRIEHAPELRFAHRKESECVLTCSQSPTISSFIKEYIHHP